MVTSVDVSDSAHLFLGSAGLGGLEPWLETLPVRPSRAVLVPTAAKPLAMAPFVHSALVRLRAAGLAVTTLDVDLVGANEVLSALDDSQAVFVTGGYTLYLLEHVRRTGFDVAVTPRVQAGSLAYVGISAGAALAGPDVGPLSDPDDPGVVDSTHGLGLVPFIVLPHRNRGRAHRHDQLIVDPDRGTEGGNVPTISISDTEAIIVEAGQWTTKPSP